VYQKTIHQKKQIKIINKIEKQVNENSLGFSTVPPVKNYESDKRICLTSVHFPNEKLVTQLINSVKPIKSIAPEHYYYHPSSIHLTVKNIRIISNPPSFNKTDVNKVTQIFTSTQCF